MPSEQAGNQDSQCGFANGHHVGLPLMWASRLPGDVLNAGGISNRHAGLFQSMALLSGTECRQYLYFLILCRLHWYAVNNSTTIKSSVVLIRAWGGKGSQLDREKIISTILNKDWFIQINQICECEKTKVIRHLGGLPACFYAQIIKKRSNEMKIDISIISLIYLNDDNQPLY